MSKKKVRNILFVFLLVNGIGCLQPYYPPVSKANTNFLVVDGTIISGQDSTIINLSRTQNINDSLYYFASIPETGAVVTVVGQNGDTYALIEQSSGRYVAEELNLNGNELYRLKIVTSNGSQYLSDSVPVKISPPIDSVSWQLQSDGGIHIFVSTHDPLGSTRYYRWQYTETWEYQAYFFTEYQYLNGSVVLRDTSQFVHNCWSTNQSSNLFLATSDKLTQDMIYEDPLTEIPAGSEELSVEYSILVKQYTMTAEAYQFYQLLLQNSEQVGSLFSAQPSSLTGNIHNVANPNEPVIGYVGISSVAEQRIFIQKPSVWGFIPNVSCAQSLKLVSPDSFAFYFGIGYVPLYPQAPPGGGYYSTFSTCAICTLEGGSNIKPSFWPN